MASILCRRLSKRFSFKLGRCIVTQNKDSNTAQYFNQLKGQLNVDSKGTAAVGKTTPLIVPIEATSVAAGLFLNKIDYSMLVYPEFTEMEDLNEVESFANKVSRLLNDKLDSVDIDKQGAISDELLHGLKKLGLYGMRIPKEYGGLEMNDKQVTRVYEELGRDWSLMLTIYTHQDLVAHAIKIFGTDEQKRKYLPRLASGESIGAFCLHEESSGNDIAAISTMAKPIQDLNELGTMTMNGTKSWVTNGKEADILIVFAKYASAHSDHSSELSPTTAFIIDRKNHAGIKILQRRSPVGLRGCQIYDLQFENVTITDADVLGDFGRGFHLAMQVLESHRFVFAAAMAAFIKRLLGLIAKHCNETKRFGKTLGETMAVQARISDMTKSAYMLETLAYYIAGVRDEDDSGNKHFQLESSMATLYARKALYQAIMDSMEIFGAASTTTQQQFERFLRDCVSLCAFLGSEDLLVSNIGLNGLTTWAFAWRDVMHKVKRPLYYPWYHLRELYASKRKLTKLKHFIYEHVHPSLEDACRNVEQSMARFEYVFRGALKIYGKDVENEHEFLDKIANTATALFASIACISRASRAYSIGLNKADFEVFLAHDISLRLNAQAQRTLEDLLTHDVRSYQDFDIYTRKIAYQITSEKGYPITSPLGRNWEYVVRHYRHKGSESNMVNVSTGVLVTCDPAMKQFLLYLDEKLELGFRFVIKNLDDDTHLFISPDSVAILQQRIDALMEKLSPDLAEKA